MLRLTRCADLSGLSARAIPATQSVKVPRRSGEDAAIAWQCTSYMLANWQSSDRYKHWNSTSRDVPRSMA